MSPNLRSISTLGLLIAVQASMFACGSDRRRFGDDGDGGGGGSLVGGSCASPEDCPVRSCACPDGSSFEQARCIEGACASADAVCGALGCWAAPTGGGTTSSSSGATSSSSGGVGGGSTSSSGGFGGGASSSGGIPACVDIADHECLTCVGPSCIGSESWQYTIDLCNSYYAEWAAYWSCIQAASTCEAMDACQDQLP